MADTLAETFVANTAGESDALWGPYWIDESIAEIVFSDSGDDLSHLRTTDKGANWTRTEITAGEVEKMACWFDQETPGDTGTLVHIAWMESVNDDVMYRTLDVSDGSLGTERTAAQPTQAIHTTSSLNRVCITKAVDGNLYIGWQTTDNATSQENDFLRSVDSGANWTSRAQLYDSNVSNLDQVLLFPADTDDESDICAIYWDSSATTISVKVYDDSSGASGAWAETNIDTGATFDSNWISMDGVVRHTDNHVLIAYHSDADSAGDDLLTWDLTVDDSTPTVTSKATVFTNQAESAQVGMMINQQNDDVYLAYLKGGTFTGSVDVVYHLSDDNLATWETESAYSEATADDLRRVHGGRTVNSGGGRWQPSFYNDDTTDIWVNEVNDVEIAAVTGQTLTATGIATAESFGTPLLVLYLLPVAVGSAESFGTPQLNLKLEITAIATAEAFGTAVIVPGAVTVSPSGIASAESFGTATLVLYLLPTGIASAESFGTATLVLYLLPTGIASSESFGTTTVVGVQTLTPTAIASAESFGTAQLNLLIAPDGIASAESFGTAVIILTTSPGGIASGESFGTPVIVHVAAPGGIASAESFGTALLILYLLPTGISTTESFGASLLVLFIAPAGIASGESFGTATIVAGAVTVSPDAIASGESFGTATLVLYLSPTGIASGESFGTAQLNLVLIQTGIASAESFGTALLVLYIIPTGIASGESFGSAEVVQILFIDPTGIASAESFGNATLVVGAVTVSPSAIASAESFGTAVIVHVAAPGGIASAEAFGTALLILYVLPAGIGTGESFGTATIVVGAVTASPGGIASGEAFGTALLVLYLLPTGIASAESFGTAQLNLFIVPTGIASAEAFGTAVLVLFITPTGIASAEAFGTATVSAGIIITPTGIGSTESFGTPAILTFTQEGFRWRNDNGSESAATWRQSQDVADSIARQTTIRIRVLVDTSGDAGSEQYRLEYKRTSDADTHYRVVPT